MNLIQYQDLCYENATISMEIDGMDSESLIDECAHLMINFESESMEQIITEFFRRGELSKDARKAAEAFYKLAYGELIWEE